MKGEIYQGETMSDIFDPMNGIRVLDISNLKGAYCTKVLADQGASVIKVEPPDGDETRYIPPFANDKQGRENSLWFAHYHANKESITLNLESSEGINLLKRLVEHADILVESNIPGAMDTLGLGYEYLSKINPSLIYASITPFGQTGPRKNFEGTELTTLATGGLTFESGLPDHPPCTAPGYMAYDFAGIYAAAGITVCLIERGLSGEGQHIDLSIQEAVAATTDMMIPAYDNEGLELTRNGFTNTRLEPAGLYKCQDGWVCFMPLRPTQWDAMVEWMGNPELLQDPIFLDMMKRSENSDILRPIIQEFVEGFKREDFLIQAQERHIPTTLVNTIPDFVSDPHVISENSLVKIDHPEVGVLHLTRPPYNVAGEDSVVMSPAPLLGQHNNEIYKGLLGLTSDQCAMLKEAGTI